MDDRTIEQIHEAAQQGYEQRVLDEASRIAAAITEDMRKQGWLTADQSIVFVVEDVVQHG